MSPMIPRMDDLFDNMSFIYIKILGGKHVYRSDKGCRKRNNSILNILILRSVETPGRIVNEKFDIQDPQEIEISICLTCMYRLPLNLMHESTQLEHIY